MLKARNSAFSSYSLTFHCLQQSTSKRAENPIIENFQVPLSSLRTSHFGAFGGPTAQAGHYVGPHGCLSTRIVTK